MKDIDIKSSLSQFANSSDENDFSSPFDDGDNVSVAIEASYAENDNEEHQEPRKKKKKKSKFERVMEKGNQLVDEYISEDSIKDFDDYLEGYIEDDDDAIIRDNLISLGRKYSRDTKTSSSESGIGKEFLANEKALERLLEDISKDKAQIQKDLDNLRMVRGRNYKTLSEMSDTKNQTHNLELAVLKELDSIKKIKIELQMKMDAKTQGMSDSDNAANLAIQKVFGSGRNSIMSSIGGYGEVSGATYDDNYEDNEEDIIESESVNYDDYNDGNVFLKYENAGVHYILLWDKGTDSKEIIAEDKDGNIVSDYPIPDTTDLEFDISESTLTATDSFHRNYEVRLI